MSSSSRETSFEESTQVWPWRRQVTTSRPSAFSARSAVPSRVARVASPGCGERVALDDRVGDPLAALLVEDRARVAAADLVGARPDRLPAELAEEVGEDDLADALAQHLGARRDGADGGGRRPDRGGRDVLDPRAPAHQHHRGQHDRERPRHQARARPADPPEPGARLRPAVPVAAPRVARPSTRVRSASGAPVDSAASDDRVAAVLLQCERRGEGGIRSRPRLDAGAPVGVQPAVDVERRDRPRRRRRGPGAGQSRSSRKQTPGPPSIFPTSARPS